MMFITKKERKTKKIAGLALAASLLFAQTQSAFAQKAPNKEPPFKIEESALPENAQWQAELSFPDRFGEVEDTLAPNSLYAFDFFEGQGYLFVQVGRDVAAFSLFVNQERVDTSALAGGRSYKIDISKIARNGKNILQATDIRARAAASRSVSNPGSAGASSSVSDSGKVKVYVPYPVLLEEVGGQSAIDSDALDLVSQIIQSDIEHGFPCAQLAVAKNGRILYKNSWGFINSYDTDGNPLPQNEREKITDDTMFDIASCAKALAANMAIEFLVSQKKLNLDTKIADVLGDDFYKKTINIKYKNGSGASLGQNKKWKAALTVRDVACHTAGFPAGPAYYNKNFNSTTQGREKENQTPKNKLYAGCGADQETRAKTFEAICKTPLLYEPGTKVLYSDADYMILGFVVERITGERLDNFCKKTFWEPLDLTRTAFNPLQNGFSKSDCAATELRGNTRGGTLLDFAGRSDTIQGEVHDETAYYSMAGVSGHAGLFTTASDALKLLSTLFYGGYGQNKFFDKDVLDSFFSPQDSGRANWAIGWYHQGDDRRSWNFSQSASRATVGHNGWTGTLVMLDPEEKLALAYFTSKRNTPYREENAYKFEGSYFTAAAPGFVPALLYEGMEKGGDKKNARLLLLSDMVRDKFRLVEAERLKSGEPVTDSEHPIVRAAYSILEVFVRRAKADGSDKAARLAKEAAALLDPTRDAAEI
ncbi:MAG: serine hydrolase, partial [Treponema sp.]|nr:serine hydrolase [Treponema sp.]